MSIHRYVAIFHKSLQLNLYQYCVYGLMYHDVVIYRNRVAFLKCTLVPIADKMNAKQKHLGCKKRRSQLEAAII